MRFLIPLLFVVVATPAAAEGPWTVGGGLGMSSPLSPREFKHSVDPNLSVGGFATRNVAPYFGARVEVAHDNHGAKGDLPSLGITRIAGGVQLMRPRGIQFYVLATVGAYVKKLGDADTVTDLGFSFGGGIHSFFGAEKKWGIGSDLRYNIATRDDGADSLRMLVSHVQLLYRF